MHRELIDKQLQASVIGQAQSGYARFIVMVPEKDSTFGLYVDYRRRNAAKISETRSLPHTDDCIDTLGDAQVFSVLDALWGYLQVSIKNKDMNMATFTPALSAYCYMLQLYAVWLTQRNCHNLKRTRYYPTHSKMENLFRLYR